MEPSMSPSDPITPGQIVKFYDVLSAALRKSGLPSEPTQQVLETQGRELADECVASVRRRVVALTGTCTAVCNYDDPQWQTVDQSRYAFVGDVKCTDYPIHERGTKPFRYRLLKFDHDPTDEEVLSKMAELNCRQPDRAEAETIIRGFTAEELRAHPVIGLTGPAVQRNGNPSRAFVYGYELGVDLDWHWTVSRWFRHCLFVAVWK